ncbi:MAG: response regulator [Bdellovibrionaceae bacterium]|nr:response regulator [Pseudobdellovibrionaceae bacterium]
MMSAQAIRILVADHNAITAKKLVSYLQDSGFTVAYLNDGLHVAQKILEFRPHFILMEMTLPNFTAFDCLSFLKEHDMLDNGNIKVFVLSQHNAKQNVETCLKMGAHDYLVKPLNPMEVLTRIALHLQARKKLLEVKETSSEDQQQTNYYLHLVELLIKTTGVRADRQQVQFQLLRMLSLAIHAVRISLIDLSESPIVVASSDNEKFTSFPLQIEKYPEIDYVQRTSKPLFIENLKDDHVMAMIREQMKTVHFNTMIVIPICVDGNVKGVLSSRLAESTQLTDAGIHLCQIVAQLVGSYWYQQSLLAKSKAS